MFYIIDIELILTEHVGFKPLLPLCMWRFYPCEVSVEMIEAVGHDYLPGYFGAFDECLKPGGKVAIQAICVPDERYETYRPSISAK